MCHQAIFYRAAFAREIGQYNNNYVIFADWDYNMRCWSKTRFSFLNVIVANYSVDGFSGQGRIDPLFDAEVTANILRYFNLSGPLKWIALSRIHSAYKAETAFSLRGRGAAGYLGAMTSSILQWPFGDVNRYKVWIHMLLTRLGIIPEKRVPADRPK
jgi:hypothetical protein